MKQVIVTGANGFIGRYTLPLLVKAGFDVNALYLQDEGPPIEGVSWHLADLMNGSTLDALLNELQASHLLHLAWYTEHGEFWHAAENLDWVACSLNLLKGFAAHGGKRVLMAGSCAEYDWSKGCCSEQETACNPATLYGTSKHALHQIAEAYCVQNHVSFAWGRIFFLYGPDEVADRFVPTVINGLLQQETVPCSEGSQLRDFMHVEDAASAFASLMAGNLTGAVNIATGDPHTLREIGEKIMGQIKGDGRIEFGALPNREGDPAVLTADITSLCDELQWKPMYSLDEGLAETIEWWKQQQRHTHVC